MRMTSSLVAEPRLNPRSARVPPSPHWLRLRPLTHFRVRAAALVRLEVAHVEPRNYLVKGCRSHRRERWHLPPLSTFPTSPYERLAVRKNAHVNNRVIGDMKVLRFYPMSRASTTTRGWPVHA